MCGKLMKHAKIVKKVTGSYRHEKSLKNLYSYKIQQCACVCVRAFFVCVGGVRV